MSKKQEICETAPDVGAVIRLARRKEKLSQQELAEQSEVSVSAIRDIERGAANPSWPILEKLARALGGEPRFFIEKSSARENGE
jgi:transcriptional regulator with XRE-family HTH domain